MNNFDCDQFRDTAPDLALGLLTGDELGAAISHVVTCPQCRRHLDGLVEVADALLLLTPSVEPAIGFESRVMARLAAGGAFATAASSVAPTAVADDTARPRPTPPVVPITAAPVPPGRPPQQAVSPPSRGAGRRPGRSHSWVVRPRTLVAAALVVALMAGGAGLAAGLARGRDSGRAAAFAHEAQSAKQLAARTAVVWADAGQSWCQLVAFPGHGSTPARLVIQLDEPGAPPGEYPVLAEPTNGSPAVLLGTIVVADGHGMLSAAVPPGTGPVDAIRVVDGGSIRYRATFAPV